MNFFFKRKPDLKRNINFGSKIANLYFTNKLKVSKFYFEYGSGSSTLLASRFNKNFISIETSYNFYKKMRNNNKNLNIIYCSLGPTVDFSYPLFILEKKIINYVKSIDAFIRSKKNLDLILIDGRFRNACCLNLLKFSKIIHKKKIIIILDDYGDRSYYKILKRYFHIHNIGRLGILKPKTKINLRINIKDYLKDPR
ncbi:hypothetical protein IDH15_00160 [Pelagibacterales bacterium SAG-MED38]|nr:hypothetical protein [Pelagibacterales bacterium SAG-MED38]